MEWQTMPGRSGWRSDFFFRSEMKRYQQIGMAMAAVAMIAARCVAQSSSIGRTTGQVVISEPGARRTDKDASRVVVWLTPIETMQPGRAVTERPRYRLVQHNKRFEPGLLVVPVGSVVDFPNADPWFHNVFSLYRGKRFDLGLYQAGS